jgi:hypothetical protein
MFKSSMEGADGGGGAEGFGGADVVCALARNPVKDKRIALNSAFVIWRFFRARESCLGWVIRRCFDSEFPFWL